MIKVLVLLYLLAEILSCNMVISNQIKSVPPKDYKLMWSDEFNGDSLDMSKWSHRYLGKRKLGYTTEDSVKVDNGTLKIIIHKNGDKYCSGMIGTQGKFETKYGYFEMKAKLPKIKGPQSAFWLMSPYFGQFIGDPAGSGMEIDIMEYVKSHPNEIHFSTHWDGYKALHKKNITSVKYPTIEDGNWHTFGVLWLVDSYKFYIDGKLMHTKNEPISRIEQFIILSAEIGPWGGNINNEVLPDQFEIDYVRVYQKNEKK